MQEPKSECPVEMAVKLIGGKWKIVILNQLAYHGPKRFNELKRVFPEVTQRMLTLQLRELEEDGLIIRKVYHEIPPKVEYSLSELGSSFLPVLLKLEEWGLYYKEQRKELSLVPKDMPSS
ncbi:helix-turn-helix transcriptional regulator [Paenibacillus pasadenensis]|uniref:winged helix-turn-helix transcriptional regulator n=1 Tax=Paenibacillus pasadenensis TaxID=217090 RepID=UPI00203C42BE|nr:helix-turn-helix domain-containing protein [Paenibacillus pasadenensis]MCM3748580.1 helix-turn-helix transcriptional regulator [Paenibacillus pasadenensis]